MWAVQHQHRVELTAWVQHTLDGSAECFSGDRADILVVIRAKIVDEQCVHTLHAIPRRQFVDKLSDGVIGTVVRNLCYGDVVVPCGESAIVGVHVADKLRIVRIAPELRWMLPRHLALNLHAIQKLIEYQWFQKWIVHEDNREVLQRVLHVACLVQLQCLLPVFRGELLMGLRLTLLGKHLLDLFVPKSKLRHGLERWQLAGGRVRSALIVQITESMHTHQVKGVQKMSADWVSGVMAVGESAIIGDHASG